VKVTVTVNGTDYPRVVEPRLRLRHALAAEPGAPARSGFVAPGATAPAGAREAAEPEELVLF